MQEDPANKRGRLSASQTPSIADAVLATLAARRRDRSYPDRPIPREIIVRLLGAASRAPSGTKTQPWRVYIVTGNARQALTATVMADRTGGAPEPAPSDRYDAESWPKPYLSGRDAVGWDPDGRLGIVKGDRNAARAWHDSNFDVFRAPVG